MSHVIREPKTTEYRLHVYYGSGHEAHLGYNDAEQAEAARKAADDAGGDVEIETWDDYLGGYVECQRLGDW